MSLLNHPQCQSHIFTHPACKTSILAQHQMPQSWHSPRCFIRWVSTTHFSGILFEAAVYAIRRRLCTRSAGSPGDMARARQQHESLRKHVPRRGDDRQRAAFSNSISLRPAAEVGPARRQVVTLSFLPSKRRGHGGDLLAPLPPAKHIVCRLSCLAD